MYAKNVTKVSNNYVAINDNNLAISQLHIHAFPQQSKVRFQFLFRRVILRRSRRNLKVCRKDAARTSEFIVT